MVYLLVGVLAWLGVSVLTAASWSVFYAGVGRDRPVLDAGPEDEEPPPSTTGASPVRLATFYRPLSDGTTEADLARVAGAAVLTRTDEAHRDRLRAAGFDGPITQYLLAFETSGPAGLLRGGAPCGWYQPYVNNMSGIAGDFCAALHGDERNFLHNGRGERLYSTQSWQEGGATKRAHLYLMNPGAPGWRAYAARRAREEVRALGYSGIFLDNVDLSLYRGQRQEANSDGAVAEYATNAAFRQAVAGFLQQVKAELGPAKLWANMTSGTDAPGDWDLYAPHLDGFMSEYFAARWGGTYASPAVWEAQLRQVEQALRQGKAFVAVGQGARADVARMRFALASYLLVASDGASFRYADGSGGENTSPSYYQLWRYPEYDARLGAPTSARYQVGGTWRRDFVGGHVGVDPAVGVGTIVTGAGVEGSTPTPNPSCSPRPPVRATATPAGIGVLGVTLATQTENGTPSNALASVQVASVNNAQVEFDGRPVIAAEVIQLPAETRHASLIVRRVAPGAASTARLVATDACGPWETLVGGGPAAF